MKTKILVLSSILALSVSALATDNTQQSQFVEEPLNFTTKWDKVFAEDPNVNHAKVQFHNRYGITLAGEIYTPKGFKGKLPAIAVAGPYGAVKEQVSGLYAQELAKRGFMVMAFDPSFQGESGGYPRDVSSPDINVEDFSAAVDYLLNRDDIDNDNVGLLGICGFGGFALSDAAMDPRVKATATVTMYDMSRVTSFGYNDAMTKEDRYNVKKDLSAQRTLDYKNGTYKNIGGVIEKVTKDTPQFVVDYHNFYKEKLGYHERSLGSNQGFTVSSSLPLMNFPILTYIDEIKAPVLIIHGEKAHSRYFSETAFKQLTGDNKELYIVKGANHTDLYYKKDVIPFDKLEKFYKDNLKD